MANQLPDNKAGDYFVSFQPLGSRKYGLVLGPYQTHAQALAMVETGKELANRVDAQAGFYGFGTCRLPENSGRVGQLNGLLASQ